MLALPIRFALAVAAPLLLVGCLLAPGKFVSTLSVSADRSFAFTYKGEVIAADPSETTPSGGEAKPDDKAEAARKKAETEAKRRAMAASLAKEAGYRSVRYVGDGLFLIDYAISGTLTHNFIYPFNADAEVVFPFLAIELRGADTVRVRAPAFAKQSDTQGMPSMSDASSRLDGTFTLDTDAEIVSQNNEAGPTAANGRRTITWRATALSKDAPTAVLRLKPAAR